MYNGIGLATARGTGTNGFVTKNAASLPKAKRGPVERHQDVKPEKIKRADPEILEHEKKRQIEIKVTKWADEQGLLDAEYAHILLRMGYSSIVDLSPLCNFSYYSVLILGLIILSYISMPREKLEQELAKARERFTLEYERESTDRNSSKRKKE